MSIIILQHSDHGMPGRLGVTLRDHGFRLDIRRPDKFGVGPQGVPTDLDNVHGIVILGGPQNVTDIARHEWMQPEVELIKRAHARELPVVGICLGHQLIAHALGGTVDKRERPSVGFYSASITVPGQTETMLSGLQWEQQQFFACGQEVKTLPPGAMLLMTSRHTKHVAFKAGIRTYAFAFHFEVDRPLMERLIEESKADLVGAGVTQSELKVQIDQQYDRYARLADRLCVNLTTYCLPFTKKLSA
jgi:GMP synthase-like glutamine amidotransferase